MKDYYQILGLERSASPIEVKKAYHRMAMRHHPDRNDSPDANDLLVEINEAYEVLSDREQRADYDQKIDDMLLALYYLQAQQKQQAAQEEDINRDPRYRRRAPRTVARDARNEPEAKRINLEERPWQQRLDFRDAKARAIGKKVSRFYIGFIMLVILDFSLPYTDEVAQIDQVREGREWSNSKSIDKSYYRVQDREFSCESDEYSRAIGKGSHGILQKTPILRTPRYLILYRQAPMRMWAYGTFYDYYLVVLVILCFTAGVGLAAEESPDLHLYSAVMASLTFFLLMILWMCS